MKRSPFGLEAPICFGFNKSKRVRGFFDIFRTSVATSVERLCECEGIYLCVGECVGVKFEVI